VYLVIPSLLSSGIASLAGCARESPMFKLDVAALGQMKPGDKQRIMFEESKGKLLVTVADRYGDGHVYEFVHPTLTREQALDLLRRKQADLEQGT
jgi:hypothetical protein